jgi:hypothetical protein
MEETVTVIYRGDKCSVILLPGEEYPSLVLPVQFSAELAAILHRAETTVRTMAPGQKVDAIKSLCGALEDVLARFGRALIDWQSRQPMAPGLKHAAIELREAMLALERFARNGGPSHA